VNIGAGADGVDVGGADVGGADAGVFAVATGAAGTGVAATGAAGTGAAAATKGATTGGRDNAPNIGIIFPMIKVSRGADDAARLSNTTKMTKDNANNANVSITRYIMRSDTTIHNHIHYRHHFLKTLPESAIGSNVLLPAVHDHVLSGAYLGSHFRCEVLGGQALSSKH
jgi:hypothetical protein